MLYGTARGLIGWAPEKKVNLKETAWLNGLRGVAAFLVMINHYSTQWTSHFWSAPFGAEVQLNINPDKGIYFRPKGEVLWGLWRLPILRLVSSAPSHVTLFYVISGFALAWGPVALVQAKNYDKLYHSLGSSLVRRWFRLYMAGALVTIAYLILKIYIDDPFHRGHWALIWEFLVKTEKWANPFDTTHITPFSTSHDFNWVMWTLPFEFSGSIFVFVSMMALGRIQDFRRRVSAVLLVSFYAALKLHWDFWLFGTGLALADYVRHHGGFRKLAQNLDSQTRQLWWAALVLGLLLMGWVGPMPWYSNPGYGWSASLPLPAGTRDKLGEGIHIWGVGSSLVVASTCHLVAFQELFEHAVIQHLGRISFMLYLIHMLVNNGIALPLRTLLYDTFCVKVSNAFYDPPELYQASPVFHIGVYILNWAICLPIVLVLSNYMEIYIDRRCQEFGRTVDRWLLNGSRDSRLLDRAGESRIHAVAEEEALCRSSSGSDLRVQLDGPDVIMKIV